MGGIWKTMSEEEAVKAFEDDGYFEYQKRTMRYGDKLPANSIWATAPATMFVLFSEDTPVGVIGFSKYKNVLLMAGTHIRKECRGRNLPSSWKGLIVKALISKLLEKKGNKTLYGNAVNLNFAKHMRDMGFIDMDKESLPIEIQQELEGLTFPDQLQKWMKISDEWFNMVMI